MVDSDQLDQTITMIFMEIGSMCTGSGIRLKLDAKYYIKLQFEYKVFAKDIKYLLCFLN